MLRPLGENLTSQDFIKIALGKQHAFVILQNGDIRRPLVVPYPTLLQAIASSIDLPAGSAAWGSILPGAGVASQTDLVTYLENNYYPLNDNPAGYIDAAALTAALLNYVTDSELSSALANYVPTSRTLTINGVSQDLSADRSWTISGGGGILHGTASGTDTYTVTIAGATAYADGDAYLIRFTNGNTTSATLNINSQGAVPLYRNNDGALIGGDIIAGGEMLCVYNSTTNRFQVIGTAPNTLLSYVTNDDSVTITKGQVVYAFGGTGDRMTVKLASNLGDATSAQTVGLVLSTSIAANQKGLIMMQGLLDGLSILPTSTWADGDPVYLGSTAGSITKVKPYAPNHLVYLGVVTTASPGSAGRMYVKIQNGYELDELHNVQARTPSFKDTLWYDNTVSPPQWKTASLATILGYTPGSVTSVSATVPAPTSAALSVSVANPTTTPAIAITANGTSSQLIRGDGSLALIPTFPVAAKFYQQDNWSAIGIGSTSVEYVPSLNKVYVTNFASNTVTILNATTGEFINAVAATNCVKCKYIAFVNQIYVTSSSATTIIRIDGTTNLPLAAISVGVTVNGLDILEYSATKVFITCGNASGSIMVVNPSAGTVTSTVTASVPAFPVGMALNTNPTSLQFDKIVIGSNAGIFIFDPTTNAVSTTVANPSSAISVARFLTYSVIDDKYYVASSSNSRLVVLSIATATTFTATFISNQQTLNSVVIDEANDYLFTFPLWSTQGTNISAKMFKKTTLEPIVTIQPLSQGGTGGIPGLGLIDLPNSRIFMVGRTAATGSVSILRYT